MLVLLLEPASMRSVPGNNKVLLRGLFQLAYHALSGVDPFSNILLCKSNPRSRTDAIPHLYLRASSVNEAL